MIKKKIFKREEMGWVYTHQNKELTSSDVKKKKAAKTIHEILKDFS